MSEGLQLAHERVTVGDGISLHLVRAGAGEPVILLHGWPQSWAEWRHVIPPLAARYAVHAVDLRGFGDSSRPLAGYDAGSVAGDIVALIGALGLEGARVVGHDLGGPVAYLVAAEPRAKVRQLAFLEAPLYGVEVEGTAEIARTYWHLAFFQVPDVPEFLIRDKEEGFLEHFMKAAAYDVGAITPELVHSYARALRAPGALRATLAHYRSFGRSVERVAEARGRGRLGLPVLALGGEACLGDIPLRLMREVATDVRGGTVPRCGHWMAEERPEELARRLLEFFEP